MRHRRVRHNHALTLGLSWLLLVAGLGPAHAQPAPTGTEDAVAAPPADPPQPRPRPRPQPQPTASPTDEPATPGPATDPPLLPPSPPATEPAPRPEPSAMPLAPPPPEPAPAAPVAPLPAPPPAPAVNQAPPVTPTTPDENVLRTDSAAAEDPELFMEAEPGLLEATAPAARHRVSITLSPIHLFLPVGEVMGEVRLGRSFSAAAIVGVGQLTQQSLLGKETYTAYEFGAQGVYYVVGGFDHGLQLGLEVLYIEVSGGPDDLNLSGVAQGVAAGPFLGYKYTFGFGLTGVAQFGFQNNLMTAEASAGSNATAPEETTDLNLLLNLNLGWSF